MNCGKISLSKTKFFENEWMVLACLILVGFFLSFLNILTFPVFSDEGIYLQYSQIIHEDFAKFKFISINNVFQDFKPPLQYWLGAFSFNFFDNPLFAGRVVSVFFFILGLIGFYFLSFNLWGKREAAITGFLYVLCPPILFYGVQFTAEIYVFSVAALVFAVAVKIMERPAESSPWGLVLLGVFGVLLGATILLFKQAGALYLYLLILLPVFYFFPLVSFENFKKFIGAGVKREKEKSDIKKDFKIQLKKKKKWARNSLVILGIIVASFLIYEIIIPSESELTEKNFTSNWTLSLAEVVRLPIDIWFANFSIVKDFFARSYSPWAFLAILAFSVISLIKREGKDLMMMAFFLAASLAIVFGLKFFNEYLYHTAVIIFLIPIISRFAVLGLSDLNFPVNKKILIDIFRGGTILILFFLTISWGYQIFLMKTSPVKYLERGSEWMRNNYLLGWSNGINIPDIVDFLANQKGKTIAFIDPQWGNPGTALQVLNKNFYPEVFLMSIRNDFVVDELKSKIEEIGFENKFVIFSAQGNAQEVRNQWQGLIESSFCDEKIEFKKHPLQVPVILCKFK